MDTALLALQWVVTFVAIGAYLVLLHPALKDHGVWGLWLLFPPVLILYALVKWQRCKYPFLILITCLVAAALLQRARLGYWAWPDVERVAQRSPA
jgi:hypothetical protein